jgi:hypothetical protein
MSTYSPEVVWCLEQHQQGRHWDTFHTLLEANDNILSELIDVFNKEPDAEFRAFLVQVVWEHRNPSVIPFLGNALSSSEPLIWKEAMDGLVALASPASLDALLSARSRRFPRKQDTEEFQGWLEEAIEQVRGILPGA